MTSPPDPLLETLVNDFGANYAFALDLLQEYRRDRNRGIVADFDRDLSRPTINQQYSCFTEI